MAYRAVGRPLRSHFLLYFVILFYFTVFMPPPGSPAEALSCRLSVRASFRPLYQTCEHAVLNANWHKWSAKQQHETVHFQDQRDQRSLSYGTKRGRKNPFQPDINRRIVTRVADTYHGNCPLCQNNSGARGQRSRSLTFDLSHPNSR